MKALFVLGIVLTISLVGTQESLAKNTNLLLPNQITHLLSKKDLKAQNKNQLNINTLDCAIIQVQQYRFFISESYDKFNSSNDGGIAYSDLWAVALTIISIFVIYAVRRQRQIINTQALANINVSSPSGWEEELSESQNKQTCIVKIKNTGRTCATNVRTHVRVFCMTDSSPKDFAPAVIEQAKFTNGIMLSPGEEFGINCEWDVDTCLKGKFTQFYIQGQIEYRDVLYNKRVTAFCFVVHGINNKIVIRPAAEGSRAT